MNILFKRAEELLICAQAQLETDGLPGVCEAVLAPGAEIALEYTGDCDDVCGMLWVRVDALYPATTVGAANTNPGNCASLFGVDLELGIMRCLNVGGDDGSPPSTEDLREATLLQTNDMLSMWRAVNCCLGDVDLIMGQFAPYGPAGGVFGSTVAVNYLEG